MKFTKEDKKDYANYLEAEIKKEQKKTESISTIFNINNLSSDLEDIKKQI